ncbi:RHS repeat-associated core domain-containing protein [Spirulina sp. 06S082]|uniref:RHS repeat-associated core domain-containing protein n=1 Tax=Spirulina sp. 06S082 TaxID=3110248 RepID=UPI002B1F4D61|nr:RHS repeat-associated core domain-containing protein [Spirulina sp. 06S082]
MTDENGNITDVYSYDAYGNLTNSVGNSENSYLFAGEQFDDNLDQYYLRQRYYDPSVGRFTRRDTYEGDNFDPITLHKYLYTGANPINAIDPSGLNFLYFSLGGLTLVDHIIPKNPADPSVTPGTNSYKNARIISRARNRAKSNKYP